MTAVIIQCGIGEKFLTRNAETGVPPDVYTRDYYESACQGYVEFRQSLGEQIPDRLRIPISRAALSDGMFVLDIGCGRGEVLVQAAQFGAHAIGFDYAVAALEIAAEAINARSDADRILIHLGNAQHLPYPDNSFDRAFMLDVVEHLYPAELHQTLVEIRRVLSPGGQLIVHTMPNTWYYRFGYPTFRFAQRLRGKRLPADPRDRWKFREVHVNEQNPPALKSALRQAGFKTRVWLQSTQSYLEEPSRSVRFVMRALVTIYPFRWIFCNDLFAIATK